MTATLTAPSPPRTTTTPAPWLERLLLSLEVVMRADRLLEPPPKGTSLDDLLAVRELIGPVPTLRDQLRQIQLAALFSGPKVSEPALEAAREFARRCAGGGSKRETFEDVVKDCLRGIERGIVARLREGEFHPELILTEWFDVAAGELGQVEEAKLAPYPLATGLVRCLPGGHPLRELKRPFLSADHKTPTVVLGLVPDNRHPRPYFTTAQARRWTSTFVAQQDARLAERPVWAMSEEEVARLRGEQAERQKLPSRTLQPVLRPPGAALPDGWRERVSLVLRTLPRPEVMFKEPPQDAALADLYAARETLVNAVPDDDPDWTEDPPDADPARGAAFRLSARYAGVTRQDELYNSMLTMTVAVDRGIQAESDEATAWAARRHKALEAELAALRAELTEWKSRKPK